MVGGVFIGGTEKLRGPLRVGIPLENDLAAAIERFGPDQVVELSDEPVLPDRRRFHLAALALAAGVGWRGGGWSMEPPPRPRLTAKPTAAVIATAKRAGKTALSGALARRAAERGRSPVIVAMSRGGPARPDVVDPATADLTPAGLVRLADTGVHAASDHVEGAVCAGVPAVGTRRCGSGLAGAPTFATYTAGVLAADRLGDFLLLEGSGSAIPPCAAAATVLAVPADADPERFSDYLHPMRVLISDAVVITMSEESGADHGHSADLLEAEITRIDPSVPVVHTVFRPYPLEPISGHEVFLATTAPPSRGAVIVDDLEARWGAKVVGVTHHLSDRGKLQSELAEGAARAQVVLTELKAAGVDVAVRFALETGKRAVFCDARAELVGGGSLHPTLDAVIDAAIDRTS